MLRELFEAASLGAPENAVGFLFWRVLHRYVREIDLALATLDLTHLQFETLIQAAWLGRSSEQVTQSEIARFGDTHPMRDGSAAVSSPLFCGSTVNPEMKRSPHPWSRRPRRPITDLPVGVGARSERGSGGGLAGASGRHGLAGEAGAIALVPYRQLDAAGGVAWYFFGNLFALRGGMRMLVLDDVGLVDGVAHQDVLPGPYFSLGLEI